MGVEVGVGEGVGVGVEVGEGVGVKEGEPEARSRGVLACARPALHRPALPCTPLHCALDMDSYCICRPPGGTMMAFGRAYSAT